MKKTDTPKGFPIPTNSKVTIIPADPKQEKKLVEERERIEAEQTELFDLRCTIYEKRIRIKELKNAVAAIQDRIKDKKGVLINLWKF